ncbi:hypothetical protein B0H17DRAFT_1128847 [Mycena rosella]|uniref:Uncharacterized protein n=1 Tax=Mycena rosella TaxID=1033263 RepID=A0AAD7DW13_MYCRO|nr:hypothetical protein B0H17DRAFT_1128847 [Mycena rosella]
MHLNVLDRLLAPLGGNYDEYEPKFSTSVPTFWSSEKDTDDPSRSYTLLIECLFDAVFGTIHCAAWNARFPSADELWMWRLKKPRGRFCITRWDGSIQFKGGRFFWLCSCHHTCTWDQGEPGIQTGDLGPIPDDVADVFRVSGALPGVFHCEISV